MCPRIIKDRMVMKNEHERVRENEAVNYLQAIFRFILERLKKGRKITCFREGSGSILA